MKPTQTDDSTVKLIPAKDHPAGPATEDDEINLLDLFLVLLRHKLLIMFLVVAAGVGAVFYSLGLENVYRSEATLTPREEEKTGPSIPSLGGLGGMVAGQLGIGGGGSLEKLQVVLNSRELTLKIINKYDIMPIIFQEKWNPESGTWLPEVEEPPTLQDGMKALKNNMLKVSSDPEKGILTVGIEHKDPETAKKIVEYYVKELSETLRAEVLHDANENKRFFREQLDRTSDVLLQEKIYNLLAKEIEKETFAKAQKYYSFQVVDPPIVPDPDKKVAPKRSIICILSVFVAFFFAVFLSFFLEFIRRIKTDDPERYRQIKDGMKPWKRI
jgi:uncharacterized protein involved in exopolysaccharide biosynthesis